MPGLLSHAFLASVTASRNTRSHDSIRYHGDDRDRQAGRHPLPCTCFARYRFSDRDLLYRPAPIQAITTIHPGQADLFPTGFIAPEG